MTQQNNEYDNTNTGALFINEKKASEKHPDYQGQINIECTCGKKADYWLSGWLRDIRNGKRAGQQFISVARGEEKEEVPSAPAQGFPSAQPQAQAEPLKEIDVEDIPF